MKDRDLYGGLVRLHILHHASHAPIFGVGIMEELAHHGYKLSAGTLYPILHSLERHGYLVAQDAVSAGRRRRNYFATDAGKEMLRLGKDRVRELYRELFEEEE